MNAPVALVCLDLQRGCAAAASPEAVRTIATCHGVIKQARRRRWPILHVHHRAASVEASRPLSGLEPLPSEPVYLRAGPSAFSHQGFARAAQGLGGPLALIGFSFCDTVLATAFAAADRKLPVEIVIDAVFATSEETDLARRAILTSLAAQTSACRLIQSAELFEGEAAALAANAP